MILLFKILSGIILLLSLFISLSQEIIVPKTPPTIKQKIRRVAYLGIGFFFTLASACSLLILFNVDDIAGYMEQFSPPVIIVLLITSFIISSASYTRFNLQDQIYGLVREEIRKKQAK